MQWLMGLKLLGLTLSSYLCQARNLLLGRMEIISLEFGSCSSVSERKENHAVESVTCTVLCFQPLLESRICLYQLLPVFFWHLNPEIIRRYLSHCRSSTSSPFTPPSVGTKSNTSFQRTQINITLAEVDAAAHEKQMNFFLMQIKR